MFGVNRHEKYARGMTKIEIALLDYLRVVDALYGHYLDSVVGFANNARQLTASQKSIQPLLEPGTDQDALSYTYGEKPPTDPDARAQHVTTQGEYKRRNEAGGANHIRAGQILIVLLAVYWDTEHRLIVARAMRVAATELEVPPLLSDLVLLRNAVVHHRGVITARTASKLAVMRTFKAQQTIVLTQEEIEALIDAVKVVVRNMAQKRGRTPTPR